MRVSKNTLVRPAFERGGASIVIWLILLVLLGALYWAHVSQLDFVARAPATVISSSRVQVIQSIDGGVLESINVREGDRVSKGQTLARFEEEKMRSIVGESEAKRAGLLANIARLQAEIADQPIKFGDQILRYPDLMRSQQELLSGRRKNLESDLRSLDEAMLYARDELVMMEKLQKNGDVSRLEVIRARRQMTEAQAKLSNRKNQYLQDANAELTRNREELAQVDQQARQRNQQLTNVTVRAPMSGIVKNVRFSTLGAVLRPGDELLSIVPIEEEMIIEARIAPRDIGFVREGLVAMIKFDAYDYTIYGTVNGAVSYVSADSVRDENQRSGDPNATYYRAHILIKSPATTRTGKQIDVIPGMTANVDIRLGSRTVLDTLLKPIMKTMSEAFAER
jgi:adhesin transport system membrane fusion protein